MNPYITSLKLIIGEINYRGYLIRYENKKYIAFGIGYDTFEQAAKRVDESRKELTELIRKQNPHINLKNK